jgi:hypothetical protein
MMSDPIYKALKPLIVLFLGITVLVIIAILGISGNAINFNVLLAGNFILFIVGIVSLRMSIKALVHKNTTGFLRLVYGAFLFKFFVLAISAITYILVVKKNINKPALFLCCGLYFVYTFIELRSVLKLSKQKNA